MTKSPRSGRVILALMLSALFGCNSAAPPLAFNPTASAPQFVREGSPDKVPGHAGSWMAKGIDQRDLLYVTNANGIVSVYTYWQRRIVGVLTNFKQPMGECVDRSGNIYITDFMAKKVFEYAHGARKPLRTINDAPYEPHGCAIDLANGNLAIANYGPSYYGAGNITVYPHGTGKPIVYSASEDDRFLSCAYDARGNLLATSKFGYSGYYYTDFFYLPKGGTKLNGISLPPPSQSWMWNFPQALLWDGTYWVVDDNGLYRYAINIKAQYIDAIQLNPSSGWVAVVAIYRKGLDARGTQVVGVAGTVSGETSIQYWKYPAGGPSFAEITKDLDKPFGVAISLRTQ